MLVQFHHAAHLYFEVGIMLRYGPDMHLKQKRIDRFDPALIDP